MRFGVGGGGWRADGRWGAVGDDGVRVVRGIDNLQ